MINKTILTATAAAGVALLAAAALPGGSDPATYGSFRSRTEARAAADAAPARMKGAQRVMAFRDDGNAEVDKFGTLELVHGEDFSLLSAGSETAPDLSVQLEYTASDAEYEYPWNNMRAEFTKGDARWGVGNGYPAGGTLYFPLSRTNFEGHVVFPISDLTRYGGAFVVEFRARLEKPLDPEAEAPVVLMVESAETHNWGPTWDNIDDVFVNTEELSTEWRTFRVLFQGGGPSVISHIVVQGIDNGVFIDDMKLYQLNPYLSTPVLARHTDFGGTEFNVNWGAVEGAASYTVNVWSMELADDGFSEEAVYVAKDVKVQAPATTLKVENASPTSVYYFTVSAENAEHKSLTALEREVFDVMAPAKVTAAAVDGDEFSFVGTVDEVEGADGYTYVAMSKRVADADGEFTITDEKFTGWGVPFEEGPSNYTRENPCDEGVLGGPYFPVDIRQQGWYGKNFVQYKDYLCLAPFFYTSTNQASEQTCWVSPDFDLSRDGGKVSVDLRVCADKWSYTGSDGKNYNRYADLVVALFTWNEAKGDFDQTDAVYVKDVNNDWTAKHVDLTGGTERSRVAFFGINSYMDLYLDDIVVKQNYKKGDVFMDPFHYVTWQLGADEVVDKTRFEYRVPFYSTGKEVYHKAFAARIHRNSENAYDGEALSGYTADGYVGETRDVTGVSLAGNDAGALVSVEGGAIVVSNPGGEEVTVVAADGRHVSLGTGETCSYVPCAKGVYAVRVGNATVKVAL